MKKIILSILLFLFSFQICEASNIDRESLDNYGVNKDIKINDNNLDDILDTKYVDADLKVYDFANILTDSEEENLREMALSFYEETGFDLVILTDSFYNNTAADNYEYAQNFYDYNDFGIDDKYYSGVLILRNAYASYPFYSIRTFGEAQLYFAGERTEDLLDNTSGYIADDNYDEAFIGVIDGLLEYYDDGISSEYKGYKIDEDGSLIKPYKFPFLIALLVSGIFTFIFIKINVDKNKMVYKAKLANDYLDSNSISYKTKNDVFLRSSTQAIPRDVSDGKSGSGGFRGSSGRSSSGGGRRI